MQSKQMMTGRVKIVENLLRFYLKKWVSKGKMHHLANRAGMNHP